MGQEFALNKPIYEQISEMVISDVLRGKYAEGERLPSVRDVAMKLGVNPNTVQRAYAELERLKVTEIRRGGGSYVALNAEKAAEIKKVLAEEKVRIFFAEMAKIGYSKEESVEYFKEMKLSE